MNFWYIILLVGLFVFVILLVIGYYDGHRYVKRVNRFIIPNLNKDCKFVMISDLHDKVYGNNNEQLLRDIETENPDFILIAGDIITSHANENFKPGVDFVNALSGKYKVYFAFGNHETKIRDRKDKYPGKYDEFINGIKNVEFLVNQSIYLEDYNLDIVGLEAPLHFFKRFKKFVYPIELMKSQIGTKNPEHGTILLAHSPEFFDTYAQWNPDLILSGHVHGGIMKLPLLGGVISPSFLLFPKYDGGIFKKGNTTMLLGRGLGTHDIHLRFFNPAELHVVYCLKE